MDEGQEAITRPMLMQQVITAGGAFMATNVDDIVLLTLLFSRLPDRGRTLPLVAGQVLGFSMLILISLLGIPGRHALPQGGLALLGFLPIAVGISRWRQDSRCDGTAEGTLPPALPGAGGPMAELVGMAGLTVANGSDNIGVYLPLFAQSDRSALGVTLVTFAAALALWMLLAWGLTRTPALTPLLQRYGGPLVPVVLIGLGVILIAAPGR